MEMAQVPADAELLALAEIMGATTGVLGLRHRYSAASLVLSVLEQRAMEEYLLATYSPLLQPALHAGTVTETVMQATLGT